MRAYFDSEVSEFDVKITGEKLHHLLSVVRLKNNDMILGLDGKGMQYLFKINEITKKEILLEFISKKFIEKKHKISIGICNLKKDSMALAVKSATELGVSEIYILESDRSQKNELNELRMQKLIVSAIEQSNSAYIPNVVYSSTSQLPYHKFNRVSVLDIEPQSISLDDSSSEKSELLLVGPEGGFTEEEIKFFKSLPNINFISLPTPILRASTAVTAGIGYLIRDYC